MIYRLSFKSLYLILLIISLSVRNADGFKIHSILQRLDSLVQKDSGDVNALTELGNVYINIGIKNEAKRFLTKAFEID